MLARNLCRQTILLAIATGVVPTWGQAPLRVPGGQDPPAVQPKMPGTKRPHPTAARGGREVVRSRLKWKAGDSQAAGARSSACTVELSSRDPLFGSAAGTAHVDVLAAPGCQWSVSSTVPWITPAAGTMSRGAGTIRGLAFDIAADTDSRESIRMGRIVVGANGVDQTWHMVLQGLHADNSHGAPGAPGSGAGGGKPCSNPIALAGQSVDVVTNSITQLDTGDFPAAFADASGGCSWNVTAVDRWLSASETTASAAGNTPADVKYQAQPNQASGQRWGAIFLQGQITGNTGGGIAANDIYLYVQQQAPAQCNYSLGFTVPDIPSTGGQYTLAVGTQGNASCQWQLQSSDTWISLGPSPSGSGDQNFSFNIPPNTSTSPRTGTISLQGNPGTPPVTIAQDGVNCTYPLTPPSVSLNAAASSSSFTVTAPAACAWTAASSDSSWLSITSGGQGAGNGAISFNVSANNSATARTATVNLQSQRQNVAAFSVNQGSVSCNYSLSSYSLNADPGGVPSGSVQVNSPSGCRWKATANSQGGWIALSTDSNTGPGPVNFSVAANNTPNSRNGTISVQDQTFTITQPAGVTCTYSLSSNTINAPSAGGTYPIQISTAAGCQWTGKANLNWISLDITSGSATGTINIAVAANNSNVSRNGTVSVNSLVLTVNESANQTTSPSAAFTASPDPVPACGGQTTGTTTFSWNAPGVNGVSLYVGNNKATLLYQGAASGTYTSSSVTDGEVVVLADNSGNVLGQVTINLDRACGAKLLQAIMTDQTDWPRGTCAVPNPKPVFTNDDTTATLWFKMQNVPAGAAVLAEFIDPYGDVEMYQTFNVSAYAPLYCNASVAGVFYDYPDGFVPATLPGGWTARLSLNGSVLGTFPFNISAPVTYAWTFTSDTYVDDESQPPFDNATKSFSLNGDMLNTYFATINSQAGDVNHIYYLRWDDGAQTWTYVDENDFDPLDSGGVWFFWAGLNIAGNPEVQQYPGYWGLVGTVTQQGTEILTFLEIVQITPPSKLQLSRTSLSFTYQTSGTVPPGQNVSVTSSPSGTAVSMAVMNGSPWLYPFLSSDATPATLSVYVNPANLAVGVYNDTIKLTGPGGSVTIPVSLTVGVPTPILSSISPAAAQALSGAVQLQTNGQNFTADSHVRWLGPGSAPVDLQTQFQSAVLLQATIPASYLTSPGTAQVSVANSLGSSNSIAFQVTAPTPRVSSISPTSTPVGSPQLGLTVNGSNFINGAQVSWKGPGGFTSLLQTQFQSSTLLQATIPASYLSSAGTASVSVSNSGVVSNGVNFQIAASAPQITTLSPNSVVSFVGPFNLIVFGSNFTTSSSVYWNGRSLPTVYLGPTELMAPVPASNTNGLQTAIIAVSDGTVTSNSLNLSVTASTGVAFRSAIMTNSAPPSDGSCGNPAATSTFVKADGTASLYFVSAVSTADNLTSDWVGPDGVVIGGGSWVNGSGTYCFYASLGIAKTPTNRLGPWQARVFDNGNFVFWVPFTID